MDAKGHKADSSTGAELYVVTGQSPRQLDRNITSVGRVVQGIEVDDRTSRRIDQDQAGFAG